MPNDSIQKILKVLNPLSCKETRKRFDALLREELRGEEEEWVQEHLLVCDECLDAFTNKVSRKVDAGEIPLQEWPSDLPLPPMELYTSASSLPAAAQEVLGVMWREVREAARQGEELAKEKLAEAQRWVEGAMMLWQMTPTRARGLGPLAPAPGVGVKGTAAEVVDDKWQPQDKVVPFEVREGPVVTADGHFTFTLHTPQPQWQGTRMVCTLLLVEGQRVSFESEVQGGQVSFTAEGLPQGEENRLVPLELLQLYLITPRDRKAER